MSTCIHVKRQYYRHPDFDPKCEEAKAELSPSHKGHEWKDSFTCSFFFFFSFFNVDASPAHVLLFCSSCWMYYSVILKPDKGEVGMLEIAGGFFFPRMPARLRERGTRTIRNAFSGGPMERPRQSCSASQFQPFFIAKVSDSFCLKM